MRRYIHLVDNMPNGNTCVVNADRAVEQVVEEVEMYTQTWRNIQARCELDHVRAEVGSDLELWMQLLLKIENERTTFDTSETQKVFGPISVDFGRVSGWVLYINLWITRF